MTDQLTVSKKNSALLVMDYQNATLARVTENNPQLLEKASGVLQAARETELPIIYLKVGFRPGHPEINRDNKFLARLVTSGAYVEGTPSAEIHTQVAPHSEDVVITKRRSGAFSTTDLAIVLKAQGINNLILMGVFTSGVVLSTVRWAADLDYDLTVIADCCADPDEEVHRVLTQKIFPNQATVVQSSELITALKA